MQDSKHNFACTVYAHSKIVATAATKVLDFLEMARAAKRIIHYKALPLVRPLADTANPTDLVYHSHSIAII